LIYLAQSTDGLYSEHDFKKNIALTSIQDNSGSHKTQVAKHE